MRRATRLVTQYYDTALAPAGLRVTQFSTLAILSHVGDGMTMNELAERSGTDRTTLTRNLSVLEKQGLLTVRPGKDTRTRVVTITKAGQDKFKLAEPHWNKAQQAVVAMFSPGSWSSTMESIQTMTAKIPVN